MKNKTTTIILALVGIAGLALMPATALASSQTGSSHASHGHAAHGSMETMKEVSIPVEVLAVAPDGKSIEVDHPPIPTFGWPAMQMSLDLENPELAEGLAAGDTVTVTIKQLSATEYVISEIRKE